MRLVEFTVLGLLVCLIVFAVVNVSSRESQWEEMRELDITDAGEQEEGEGDEGL